MTHAWCHDTARDAAVRAAEDGRTGPLPTLGGAIAAVTKTMPDNGKGKGMEQGLRTERVVLEVTHQSDVPIEQWGCWQNLFVKPESVRVVEEDREAADRVSREEGYRVLLDEVLAAREERDAAIRERDALRASAITQALTADRFASAVAEADMLRARVAELEAKLAPHANAVGGSNHAAQAASGGGEQPRGWLTEEEIKSINWLLDNHGKCVVVGTDSYYRENIAKLIARSSPPEVVKPFVDPAFPRIVYGRDSEWLEALAAAGVAVKEVG